MAATPEDLKAMIEAELTLLTSSDLLMAIRNGLVEPRPIQLNWDYGTPGQQFDGWIVFDHAAISRTCIAYCEQGFGPTAPWGLIWDVEDRGGGYGMGMDSGWYQTFIGVFKESWAGVDF